MKRTASLFILGLILLGSLNTLAVTPPPLITECVLGNSALCADIQFLNVVNTEDEAEFTVKIRTPDESEVKNVIIKLRMVMGTHEHGSGPVFVQMTELNSYDVNNAWFTMASTEKDKWFVQINFDFNNSNYQVRVPVHVKKKD